MMALSSCFKILLLTLLVPSSDGHALWQQNVSTDDGKSISSIVTFSELPGLENATNEKFAQMAYDKGVELRYADIEADSESVDLEVVLAGNYLVAKLPADLPDSYLLEGYSYWGTFSEGDRPPSLIKFFTSASTYSGNESAEKMNMLSKNELRVHLKITHGTGRCVGGGYQDHTSVCVQVTVVHDMLPVPETEVSLYHGLPEATKVTTDSDGVAYYSVPKSHKRLFAKANFKIDTPGMTPNGEKYVNISNWATAVLELTSSLEPYQVQEKGTQTSHATQESIMSSEGSTPNDTKLMPSSTSTVTLLVLASFLGSFLGSALSARISNNRYRNYNIAQNLDNHSLKLEKAEAC